MESYGSRIKDDERRRDSRFPSSSTRQSNGFLSSPPAPTSDAGRQTTQPDDVTPFIPSPLSVFLDVSHVAAVAELCEVTGEVMESYGSRIKDDERRRDSRFPSSSTRQSNGFLSSPPAPTSDAGRQTTQPDDVTPFIPSPLSVFLDVSHVAAVAELCG
nr:hypothetical protein Itr_chr11CG14480 [Ipomoea trifida]